MLNLEQTQKFELAEKLLECPQLTTASGRVNVAGQLSTRIKTNIRLGATNTPKEEVIALIDAAANVEQGIAEFVEVLGFFEGGSIAFEAVQSYLAALGVSGLFRFNSNLLPLRNPKFIGRVQELKDLYENLKTNNTVAVTALHGLGGVGKTSIAIEYLYQHQTAYNLIFWLQADSKLTLELEFIKLLVPLGLPSMPDDSEENRAKIIEVVKNELALRGKSCLLIFDNAEKPEDVTAFRPSGATGHVIITSRNRQIGRLGSAVEVDVLPKEDALRLLAVYCYPGKQHSSESESPWRDDTEKEAAERLVAELGYLALAITQAGAYIQATSCGVAGYLAKFRQHALALFGVDSAKPLDYKDTVATTWLISFEAVQKANPAAADFLSLLAFFAPDAIYLRWFTGKSEEAEQAKQMLPERVARLVGDEMVLDGVIAELLRYSLVTRGMEGEAGILAIHRLVQLVTREKLADAQEPLVFGVSASTYWCNQAVGFLVASFPQETKYTNLAECDTLISHLQALVDYTSQTCFNSRNGVSQPFINWVSKGMRAGNAVPGLDLVLVGALFVRTAGYYYWRVLYAQAKPLFERALAVTEKTLGSDHPDFATILNNLANLLYSTGDYAAARPLFERALAITEKTLGSDHPDFATRLNNLAALLKAIGEYAAAKPLYERAIAIGEKTLGSDHPDLATWLDNLANLFCNTGDYVAAKPLYERAIAITEKTLGSDHPQLAISLNNLANLFCNTGDYVAARPLYERAIAIGEKTLGSDHPQLATWLNNLALLLCDTGDYAAAKPLLERAIAIGEKTLGSDHPQLATWLNNLALLLQATGNYAAAKPLYERALAITEKTLGSNHPDFATRLNGLASLLQTTGDYAAARPLFERALAIDEKTLGADHPSFAISLNNLANLLSDTGDYVAAKPLYERALAITEKTLGSDHPDFATRLNNLAALLKAIGEYAAAKPLYERALAITEKTLGSNHPSLATSLNNLASLLQAIGEYAAAKPLLERGLAITEKTLGSNHPSLAIRLNNLANLLQATGDYATARPMYERSIAITEKTLGSDHPSLANRFNNLANLLHATGEKAEALELLRKALAIFEKKLGAAHPNTNQVANDVRQLENQLAKSNHTTIPSTPIEIKLQISVTRLDLANWLHSQANLLLAEDKHPKAKLFYQVAASIREQVLGSDNLQLAASLSGLALASLSTGKEAKAFMLLKKELAILERQLGATHPHTLQTAQTIHELEAALANDV